MLDTYRRGRGDVFQQWTFYSGLLMAKETLLATDTGHLAYTIPLLCHWMKEPIPYLQETDLEVRLAKYHMMPTLKQNKGAPIESTTGKDTPTQPSIASEDSKSH